MAIDEESTKQEQGQEREEWIYTYGDMITLLLIFFIVIFTNVNPETEKLKAISASFRGGPPASPYALKGGSSLFEELFEKLQSQNLKEEATLSIADDGVKVVMHEGVLFKNNSFQLSPKAQALIKRFSTLILTTQNGIVVEGHSDQSEGGQGQKNTKWELSALRSAAVVNAIESSGINPRRIEIVAFSDTKPKVESDDPLVREINQRVDILIRDVDPL